MLRKVPSAPLRDVGRRLPRREASRRFRPVSARTRLRRRLFLFSAPVAVLLLLAGAKMIGVGIVGHWAVTDFRHHDIEELRHDVGVLGVFDVIDPAKTSFAAGDLNVLEGRLQEADDRFSDSLARTGQAQSCPVRVNLLLTRETRGDLASRAGKKVEAERFYTTAMVSATGAPSACFAGNADPDLDRRAVRQNAIPRLRQKIAALHELPPPQSPGAPEAPSAAGIPPAPEPGPGVLSGPEGGNDDANRVGVFTPVSPDRLPVVDRGAAPGHTLGTGDPLDQLQKLLDNSNAYGDNRE